MLTWAGEPTSLPKSLYTCETLVSLCLSGKILIDVPSLACLPSLKGLRLSFVVYKDEDSVVRLLSSCPILKSLVVDRQHQDNVNFFNIKVPSLEYLSYNYVKLGAENEGIVGTLVIDSPILKKICITDYSGDSYSFGNKPRLDKAKINLFYYPDNKFMRSLSSNHVSRTNFERCNGLLFSFQFPFFIYWYDHISNVFDYLCIVVVIAACVVER